MNMDRKTENINAINGICPTCGSKLELLYEFYDKYDNIYGVKHMTVTKCVKCDMEVTIF